MIFFKKIENFLNPSLPIAGLEIGDIFVRFAEFGGGRPYLSQASLPPGTVAGGVIKNREALLSILADFRKSLPAKYNFHSMVATVAVSAVRTNVISVPAGASKESRRLAIELAKPSDIKEALISFTRLDNQDSHHENFFASFIEREIVEEYRRILSESGFNVVAFEFPAVSLCRLAYKLTGESTGMVLSAAVMEEGLLFTGSFLAQPCFAHFESWTDLRDQEGGTDETQIASAVKRVGGFYGIKFGRPLSSVILFAPYSMSGLTKKISEAVTVKVKHVANWPLAAGAALRQISNSSGNEIDFFAPESSAYYLTGKTFFLLWHWIRNLTVGLCFLILLMGLALSGLYATKFFIGGDSSLTTKQAMNELSQLEGEAKLFNSLVGGVVKSRQSIKPVSSWMKNLNVLAGAKITIEKLNSLGGKTTLAGFGSNEVEVANFRKRLEGDKNFSDVTLPLSSIVVNADGTVMFEATLLVF